MSTQVNEVILIDGNIPYIPSEIINKILSLSESEKDHFRKIRQLSSHFYEKYNYQYQKSIVKEKIHRKEYLKYLDTMLHGEHVACMNKNHMGNDNKYLKYRWIKIGKLFKELGVTKCKVITDNRYGFKIHRYIDNININHQPFHRISMYTIFDIFTQYNILIKRGCCCHDIYSNLLDQFNHMINKFSKSSNKIGVLLLYLIINLETAIYRLGDSNLIYDESGNINIFYHRLKNDTNVNLDELSYIITIFNRNKSIVCMSNSFEEEVFHTKIKELIPKIYNVIPNVINIIKDVFEKYHLSKVTH